MHNEPVQTPKEYRSHDSDIMEPYELSVGGRSSPPPTDLMEEVEDEMFHAPATTTPCTVLLF